MGPASFIMVLVGCAQANQCAPIVTLPAAYRNEQACLAARSEIVAASSGLSFDRVYADCRRAPGSARATAKVQPTA